VKEGRNLMKYVGSTEYWIEKGFPCSYLNAHPTRAQRGRYCSHKVIIKYVKKFFLQFICKKFRAVETLP